METAVRVIDRIVELMRGYPAAFTAKIFADWAATHGLREHRAYITSTCANLTHLGYLLKIGDHPYGPFERMARLMKPSDKLFSDDMATIRHAVYVLSAERKKKAKESRLQKQRDRKNDRARLRRQGPREDAIQSVIFNPPPFSQRAQGSIPAVVSIDGLSNEELATVVQGMKERQALLEEYSSLRKAYHWA